MSMLQVEPPKPSFLDVIGNLLNAANPLANMARVGSSTTLPIGKNLAEPYFPFTFGSEDPGLGDVAKDVGLLAAGGVAGKLIGSGIGQLSNIYRNPTVQTTLSSMHRGPAGMRTIHPRDVPSVSGRSIGPGTYLSDIGDAWTGVLSGARDAIYRVTPSPMAMAKLARSRGYADANDMWRSMKEVGMEGAETLSNFPGLLNNLPFDSPAVQNLLRQGFIGYQPKFTSAWGTPPTGELTNWLVGARDIARVNPNLPTLGLTDVTRLTALQNQLNRLGAGVSSATAPVANAMRSVGRTGENVLESLGQLMRKPGEIIRKSQADRAAAEAARKAAEEAARRRQSLLPPPPPR